MIEGNERQYKFHGHDIALFKVDEHCSNLRATAKHSIGVNTVMN